MAELIVSRALFIVLQNFVSGGYFLELMLALGVALISVGVILLGQLAIRAFDVGGGGIALHTQHVIKVGLGH